MWSFCSVCYFWPFNNSRRSGKRLRAGFFKVKVFRYSIWVVC